MIKPGAVVIDVGINRSDDGKIVYNLYTVVNEEYGLVQFKYELYK